MRFLETSAKANINVEAAFESLARCASAMSFLRNELCAHCALASPFYSDIKARLIDPNASAGGAAPASSGGVNISAGGTSASNKSGCC